MRECQVYDCAHVDKRELGPLDLEFTHALNHLTWTLGNELGSSGRAFFCWAISPLLPWTYCFRLLIQFTSLILIFIYILKVQFSLKFIFYIKWWRRWWVCVSGMGKHVWKRELNVQELLFFFFHFEFSGSNLGHQVCSESALNGWGIFWPCLFLRQCATMSPLLAWNLGSTWVSLMIVGIMNVYLALVVLEFLDLHLYIIFMYNFPIFDYKLCYQTHASFTRQTE